MVRLLLLEDLDSDAELIERELRRGGLHASITRAETETAFRDALVGRNVDVILADYHLPGFDGMIALAIAREIAPDVSFIFVSGSIGEERAVAALRNGATDYVLKDRLTRLPAAISRALGDRAAQDKRKDLERQLEQARRISGLGRIAATTAHEFNNVLMGIQPFVEILERSIDDPRVRKIAQQLTRSVQRGKSITHEILRFANDSELDLQPLEISPWLDTLAGELRALLGAIALRVESPADGLRIFADSSALQQIVTNLVINARDAMQAGGTVTIRARRPAADETFAFGTVPEPARFLLLSVADSGGGITADVMERIFEPMFTTKRKGNGLGLAFAHQAVMRHGGHIFVESAAGRGATFHLFIPLTSRQADVSSPESVQLRAAGARVLLVEDDVDVADATAAALEFAGFTIDLVRTGAEVESGIERFRPDAIILDIGLPDESGFDVYERIVARWPELPVIFASGHVVDTQRAAALGRAAALTKPYTIADLVSAFLTLTSRDPD